jgi:hypothetical protein
MEALKFCGNFNRGPAFVRLRRGVWTRKNADSGKFNRRQGTLPHMVISPERSGKVRISTTQSRMENERGAEKGRVQGPMPWLPHAKDAKGAKNAKSNLLLPFFACLASFV